FYLKMGFDEVHVVDNDSRDGSRKVVRQIRAAGLPVFLAIDRRPGYEKYLTEHYRATGRKSNARWIFFLDCDEFILFPQGVKSYLASLDPEINSIVFRVRDMYPRVQSEKGQFLLSDRARPGFLGFSKKVTRFDPGARVYGGKHRYDLPNE